MVPKIINLKISLRTAAILTAIGLSLAIDFSREARAAQVVQTQPGDTRKVKTGTPPEYPDLARHLNIKGLARVELTVTPDGSVKAVRELGGHPLLLEALVKAVKKWKYEPSPKESTIEVRATFGQ
ncbi:MAG TPA: energy transducer TonB [Candidatus Angelobacter sp.]|nr:energy transducer TonB [Candidatus Angelobacter sp.]